MIFWPNSYELLFNDMITDERFGNKDLSRVTARSRMISRVLSEIARPDVRASDDARGSPVSPLLARNSAETLARNRSSFYSSCSSAIPSKEMTKYNDWHFVDKIYKKKV